MNVKIKTQAQIENYRETGRIAAEILTTLIDHVVVGVSTYELAKIAEDLIVNKYDAIASCIGQYDFEYALCSSVNNVICHGVPSKDEILKDGDIVNLDITVKKHGLISDTSRMYLVGNVSSTAAEICKISQECLYKGIEQVKPGNTLGDIGFAVHKHATRNGYSIVREFCGHGVGTEMHEEPQVLHWGKKGKGMKLVEGMTFTIEPMLNEGSQKIKMLEDDWTAVTYDGKLSAQWEHTVLVTKNGHEILTLRDEELKKKVMLEENV